MSIKRMLVFLCVLLIFLGAETVPAEEKPLWEVGLGVAALYLPDYRGSDEGRFYVLPYPYMIYRGDFLRVDRDRISGRIFETDRLLFDVSFYGSVPVDSDDNDDRRGMPDLDPTFEVGPALNITLLKGAQNRYKLGLNFPVRAVFSTDFSSVRHEGWIFSPRLNFEWNDVVPGTGLNFGLSAGPIFADSGYHDYYYTVEPRYAASWRPAYDSDGGYSGSAVTVGLNKTLNSFILGAFVSMDFLEGAEIEDSPLVTTKHSVMGGVTVSWVFFKSVKMVTVK
jgi:outer membrane scaffolding protein for murein synthesis (MipA/OmpV family)